VAKRESLIAASTASVPEFVRNDRAGRPPNGVAVEADASVVRSVLREPDGHGTGLRERLEREGVESFAKSYHDALATLDKKRGSL